VQVKARSQLDQYLGKVSPFPVTTPLGGSVRGKTVAYLAGGTPTEAAYVPGLKAAAKLLGVKLVIVPAGSTAESAASAANAIAAMKPAAVLDIVVDPILWQPALKSLQAHHIPILGAALSDATKYGITPMVGPKYFNLAGKAMADYLISQSGDKTNAVFYDLPELGFTPEVLNPFKAEFTSLCPTCSVRVVNLPVPSVGTTAPSQIVADLQGHPSTNSVALVIADLSIGLAPQLQRSGLTPKITEQAPDAATYQYLKDGSVGSAWAYDAIIYPWIAMDSVARLMLGKPLDPGEVSSANVYSLLRPQDVTFNPATGWDPYPNYVSRLTKLWGV